MTSAIAVLKETSQQRRRKSTRAELEEQVAQQQLLQAQEQQQQQQQQQQLQSAAYSRAQASTVEAEQRDSDSDVQASPEPALPPDLMGMDGSEIEHRGAAMKLRDVRDAPTAHGVGARVRPVPQMPVLRHERIPGLGGQADNRQQHAFAEAKALAGQGAIEGTKAGEGGPAAQQYL